MWLDCCDALWDAWSIFFSPVIFMQRTFCIVSSAQINGIAPQQSINFLEHQLWQHSKINDKLSREKKNQWVVTDMVRRGERRDYVRISGRSLQFQNISATWKSSRQREICFLVCWKQAVFCLINFKTEQKETGDGKTVYFRVTTGTTTFCECSLTVHITILAWLWEMLLQKNNRKVTVMSHFDCTPPRHWYLHIKLIRSPPPPLL